MFEHPWAASKAKPRVLEEVMLIPGGLAVARWVTNAPFVAEALGQGPATEYHRRKSPEGGGVDENAGYPREARRGRAESLACGSRA